MNIETEIKNVAFALGIRKTNILKVEKLINGVNIYIKNRQTAQIFDCGSFVFAHHSQIAKYRNMKFKDIKIAQEKELK